MIQNIYSFEINSHDLKETNNTNMLIGNIPGSTFMPWTHFDVTRVNIPDTWTQLDETDYLTLVEGDKSKSINYTPGSYKTKANMMLDLKNKLNQISPYQLIYDVVDNNNLLDDNSIKITVNDTVLAKKIILNDKYLKFIYGLQLENTFVNVLVGTPINLHPISSISVHSNLVSNGSSDIICTVDVHSCGGDVRYELLTNQKPFSGNRQFYLKLTDFDGYPLDIYNNDWSITICLYTYREKIIDKLNHFIDYMAQGIYYINNYVHIVANAVVNKR